MEIIVNSECIQLSHKVLELVKLHISLVLLVNKYFHQLEQIKICFKLKILKIN